MPVDALTGKVLIMTSAEFDTGTALVPSEPNRTAITLDTSGPCLRGTVRALIEDDGDAKMQPEQESAAVSEATRYAEAILEAYVEHYGIAPVARSASGDASTGFPTGLLYGLVQSGKTRAITLTTAIRFAIAMAPKTMIKMMATGVSHARILVCSEFAPVRNGDADCASASCGSTRTMLNAITRRVALPCVPRAQSMLHPHSNYSGVR